MIVTEIRINGRIWQITLCGPSQILLRALEGSVYYYILYLYGATNVVRIKKVMCSYLIYVSGNEQKMTLGKSSPV
jgi:hypothetical protein